MASTRASAVAPATCMRAAEHLGKEARGCVLSIAAPAAKPQSLKTALRLPAPDFSEVHSEVPSNCFSCIVLKIRASGEGVNDDSFI